MNLHALQIRVSLLSRSLTTCCSSMSRGHASIIITNKRHVTSDAAKTSERLRQLKEAVASGGHKDLSAAMKEIAKFADTRNQQGLTSIMMAAIYGHTMLAEEILKKGCDTSLKSPSGHTAVELAAFYQHKEVHDMLLEYNPTDLKKDTNIFFCDNPLDKKSAVREKTTVMSKYMKRADSSYILMYKHQWPLIISQSNTSSQPKHVKGSSVKPKLLTVDYQKVLGLIGEDELINRSIFLGLDSREHNKAYFAVDISEMDESNIKHFHPQAEKLMQNRGLMTLSAEDAAMCGQARCLVDWNRRYKFCSTCGSETRASHAGYKRKCTNNDCLSNKAIYNTSYPRVDPSVICLIESPGGEACLLARQKRFIANMYSCIAGFMEPGESIEMTVEREIFEEAGIRVGNVKYISSQPWPMPNVLMIGLTARAQTNRITVDRDELDDARWFDREELVSMITKTHVDGLFLPPRQAIAHQLTKQWLLKTAFEPN